MRGTDGGQTGGWPPAGCGMEVSWVALQEGPDPSGSGRGSKAGRSAGLGVLGEASLLGGPLQGASSVQCPLPGGVAVSSLSVPRELGAPPAGPPWG